WGHVLAVAASRRPPGDRSPPPEALPGRPDAANTGCLPIIALGREAGRGDDTSANKGLVTLFTSARQAVRVLTPNLNATMVVAALVDGTKQSDVYVVVSKGFTEQLESLPGQGGGNESVVSGTVPKVLAARGGDPCKLHIRWYAPALGREALWGEVEGASHAKYASADGQVVVVGS